MEESWIKIYEIDDYKETNEPTWLEQLLIDNNILYNSEIDDYWIGIRLPKYKKRLKVFVQKKYEKTVKKYIEDFQNPRSIKKEDIEELKDTSDDENDIEVERHSKIGKIGLILWMAFLLIVCIFGIIGTIITNCREFQNIKII